MRITKTGHIIAEKSQNNNAFKTSSDSYLPLSPYPYFEIIGDLNSCKDCSHHDKKIISAADVKEGINVPPFHPNCKCMVIGCFNNDKMDPFEQENTLWDYLLAEKLSDKDLVQLLRNFYSIDEKNYTKNEILINYLISILHAENMQETMKGFINRLDPEWIDPNLEKRFQFGWTGEHVDAKFKQKVADIAELLGVSPDGLMKVMASESRINPRAGNIFAIGLIQFTKPACDGIGVSREKLESMSAIEQLDWVYEYFKPNAGKFTDEIDLYWNMFTNKPIGKNDYDIIYDREGTPGYYNSNSGVDYDKDGKITRRDLAEHLERQLKDYWENWAKS